MKSDRVFWIVGLLAFLLLFSATSEQVVAGTTGKIKGQIVDSNGQALPGANVIIEGTSQGTTTGPDGDYLILLVNPGTYTLTASMIGYDQISKTDVQAIADFTTTVDFALKETTLDMAAIVVVAERPPVEPDRTTTTHILDNSNVEEVAPIVKDTEQVLELLAGVGLDGDTSIRGGDTSSSGSGSSDVVYYVDGVPMSAVNVERRSHASRNFQSVNSSAVQELAVVTGGMEAEYGNAQAGVVNIVTKEGSRDFHGNLDYLLNPAGKKHWGSNVYDSPYYEDKMKWNDSNWTGETDPVTGRRVHERIDYTGVIG
ncbi:MAG: TonB-dependent receptor, partial [Gemmatimonadota bacterium]|nr:TonB-dependent receptor [Gemmatimonadota bacterium]